MQSQKKPIIWHITGTLSGENSIDLLERFKEAKLLPQQVLRLDISSLPYLTGSDLRALFLLYKAASDAEVMLSIVYKAPVVEATLKMAQFDLICENKSVLSLGTDARQEPN